MSTQTRITRRPRKASGNKHGDQKPQTKKQIERNRDPCKDTKTLKKENSTINILREVTEHMSSMK